MSEHIRISAADQIHLTEYINEHYNSEAQAMQMASGEQISITWRVPSAKGDCKYCGPSSKCFCGHTLRSHKNTKGTKLFPCQEAGCKCKCFSYIPSHGTWIVKCNCKHDPQDHNPDIQRKCRICSCPGFNSNYTCECKSKLSDHKMFFESAGERIKAGRSAEMTFSSLAPPEDPDKALPGSNPRAIQGKSSPSSGAESGDSSYDPSVSAYSLLMAPHQLGGGGRMITGGKAASGAGRGAGRAIAAPKTYGKKKY